MGYRLREDYGSRWFRIHTLPNSKRYAEGEEEYREILRRHNDVLTEVLGDDEPFILVLTSYSMTSTPVDLAPTIAKQYAGIQSFLSACMEDGLSGGYWHFFMATLSWQSGMTDTLLQQVADDVAGNVLFVSMGHTTVYHPYDGGADVILPSPAARDAMRNHYASWLSSHPLGL